MAPDAETIAAALEHLRRRDASLRRVIDAVGPYRLQPRRDRFQMLVRSILSQQLSTSSARAIIAKVDKLAPGGKYVPEAFARLTAAQLRSAGVSQQKAAYLHDLSAACGDGRVRLARIGRKSDEQVIDELIQVKGIGRWTAQMFLIFSLGRLDVFPHDDLGIRMGLRNVYGLADLPKRDEACRIAQPWRPYSTVASWYLWRSLEQKS
jgi:DNA-3-methyladenine glycosylase II